MFSFTCILCFCLHTDKHLADLSLHTSDTQSIHITHTHTCHMYWTSKFVPTAWTTFCSTFYVYKLKQKKIQLYMSYTNVDNCVVEKLALNIHVAEINCSLDVKLHQCESLSIDIAI